MVFSKHYSQINRNPENFSKSVKLDIKKACNRNIKQVNKNPNLTLSSRENIIQMYKSIIEKLKL